MYERFRRWLARIDRGPCPDPRPGQPRPRPRSCPRGIPGATAWWGVGVVACPVGRSPGIAFRLETGVTLTRYSGKHHRHGLHVLALTDEKGRLIWISAARPGRSHDVTAARRDHLMAQPRNADLGFTGLHDDPGDAVVVPGFKTTRARKRTPAEKEANRVLGAGRAPVEHGFAHLKNWRILTKLRTDPARATHLLRSLLILANLEAIASRLSTPQTAAHDQFMPPEQRHRAGIG
ncbi:transposase family protein [Streptomyces sp. NPDC091271]|uniref:transposase family protein n=1 Tax=Streptomyces sp. NPDC091271 TaxID=3365980 RepID=UPI0037FF62AD